MVKVAFQGEAGAYSEEALRRHFAGRPDLATLPCRSVQDLFHAVESGDADCGMVPLENSLGGSVTGVTSLLLQHPLSVTGETFHAVRHNLLTLPGCRDQVKFVRSHPQALEQCRAFLRRHGYVREDWYDTAGAAKNIAEIQDPRYGAIAGSYAAEVYGLEITEEGIEDHSSNQTRFLVVGGTPPPRAEISKTSILYSVSDRPGALVNALRVFSDAGINLTSISSFPSRVRHWNYDFYMDFIGHTEDSAVADCMRQLASYTTYVKVLGSYPAADRDADAAVPEVDSDTAAR